MSEKQADDLPIRAVLPRLREALANATGAVLVAPPGAGKTTAVAPALLREEWCTGSIIVTSPRRVAARAAAERMAEMLGENPGQTVGYMTRLGSKTSRDTRIFVVTEAILVNRIIADPELGGVSAILIDEAHERHLDSDFALALAVESQQVLREDLRILIMSATIDGARFARLLGEGTPVIESEGRAYPLHIEWLGSKGEIPIEDQIAAGVSRAWREQQGDILAFLPGVREIDRAAATLAERLPAAVVLPLHGQVDPKSQREAIRRDPHGRRRIVLATAIAETSLTLDGVSVVVDSGLSRRAEFDLATGTTQLVTRRASQASAAQRAGRAARQGPGFAYRLWEEAGHAGRPAFDPPEIGQVDLAPLVLAVARWGSTDPAALPWLDPPAEAALAVARGRLQAMGALDEDGRITDWGTRIAALPLPPELAASILFAAQAGGGPEAAKLAVLVQERGLGGRGEDLTARLARWNGDRSQRAEAARRLAAGWSVKAKEMVTPDAGRPVDSALHFARAMPDMIARRRGASGEDWLSAGGRGYRLDAASSLARSEFLLVADAQGMARGARITAALALERASIERWLPELIERRSVVKWNAVDRRVEARSEQRLGHIVLASGPDPDPDQDAMAVVLLEQAKAQIGDLLPQTLVARARFAGIAALDAESLLETAALWLEPLLRGKRSLALEPGRVSEAILGMLDWNDRQALDRLAPQRFASPAGTSHAIDYAGDDAPSVEVRAQALFGLDRHPMIGETPLLLKLTSPAGRPIQSTRDLPAFWRGSWADVCKDMKGRYPKHRWPERPWEEKPSLKTKNAFAKRGG